MGREKVEEEDVVFSPFLISRVIPLLYHLARCRVLQEDDWGRIRPSMHTNTESESGSKVKKTCDFSRYVSF